MLYDSIYVDPSGSCGEEAAVFIMLPRQGEPRRGEEEQRRVVEWSGRRLRRTGGGSGGRRRGGGVDGLPRQQKALLITMRAREGRGAGVDSIRRPRSRKWQK